MPERHDDLQDRPRKSVLLWPALTAAQYLDDAKVGKSEDAADEMDDERDVARRVLKRHCGLHRLPKTLAAMQEAKLYRQVLKYFPPLVVDHLRAASLLAARECPLESRWMLHWI